MNVYKKLTVKKKQSYNDRRKDGNDRERGKGENRKKKWRTNAVPEIGMLTKFAFLLIGK